MATLQSDIEGSIVNQTKRKFKISLIRQVNLEVKTDKYESKVVVLPQHGQRFMIFSNKNPSKLEYNIHYLDIKSLESKSPQELKLSYGETKQLRLTSAAAECDEMEEILLHIGSQLKTVFPLLSLGSLIPKVDLSPTNRMTSLTKKLDAVVVNDHSACSGFSRMYACVCDLYGCALVEEIIWDLDTIYLSHDSRTLYLRDFDHLSVRDHVPLLGALQYNEWFSEVDASNMKMTAEALVEVLKVVKRNTSISSWNLASTGLKSDFLQKFSSALSSNVASKIVSLNLSGNVLEDKGLTYLSEAIGNMVHGMHCLDLSQCSFTVKGVNKLMEGVALNHIMTNTLHTLNLSGNNLKGDELLGLHSFLAQPNVLQTLDMSDTEAPLDTLFTALARGCTQHLEDLNVSGNPFSAKRTKDTKPSSSWKQFFCSTLVLSKLNMSNTKLPASAIKELLLGLSSNNNKPLVHLDLSCNEMKSEGGMVLGGCVANLQNIHGLDLSDNGLDAHLTDILPWFGKNGTIHHLSIGKNFSQLRNKALQQALEGLVRAIQDEHCALESLNIADSRLKLDTTVIINALGSNTTLKSLDISGNQIGDIGAKMLAKALTINSTLTNVVWDKNGITSIGLRDVAQALQRNMTMLQMPLPIFDIAACVRINPDAIHSSSMQIQTCLQRNHAPKKINYDQCYRLQQGFLVSSAQSIIDKKVKDIHVLMNSLCETDNLSPEQFAEANKLLADADRAKQILVALQSVSMRCEETPNKFTESIQEVTTTLSSSVNQQLDEVRQDMLKMVGKECNTVLTSKDTETTLESGARSRGQLSQSEISSLINKRLVSDIQNKLSSLNFNVAFYIAEEVIDKIVDLLRDKYKELKSMKRGTTESTVTVQSTQSDVTLGDTSLDIDGSPTPGMGMTFLGDVQEHRLSYMKTLKRRPQSILVRDVGEASRDFTGNMNAQSDADMDMTEEPQTSSSQPNMDEVDSLTAPEATDTTAECSATQKDKVPNGTIDGSAANSTDPTDNGATVEKRRSKSGTDRLSSPMKPLSFVEDIMGALSNKGINIKSEESTAGETVVEDTNSGAKAKPRYTRSVSDITHKPVAKPKVASPPPTPTKPKPLEKPKSIKKRLESPTEAAEDKVDDVKQPETPAPSLTTSVATLGEPEIPSLPDVQVQSSLVHFGKDRPRRVKKQAARRPVPKATATADTSEVDADPSVDDFFKPAVVSQTPVLVTTPAVKPRPVKGDKPEVAAKTEKQDGSPKMKTKLRSPFGGSHKDKQEDAKKKGKTIADSLSSLFNKKKKNEKTVDQPDTKSGESTPVPPARPDRTSNLSTTSTSSATSKPPAPAADIPEEPKSTEKKSGSLERGLTPDSMSTSMTADTPEEQGGIIAPKKKPVGFGMPGMSGGLLAEMQAKRNKAALQPKAAPRSTPTPAKAEETVSFPTRPQPPALKPVTPTSEVKKDVAAAPPARPSPPKPSAAPRENAPVAGVASEPTPTPAAKPAKPPVLRPKPPPKLKPKPTPGSRPSTMMDLSTSGSTAACNKSAPPKPPPPDPSKRQTYVAPKVLSPVLGSPIAGPQVSRDKPAILGLTVETADRPEPTVQSPSPKAKSPPPVRPPSPAARSATGVKSPKAVRSPPGSTTPVAPSTAPATLDGNPLHKSANGSTALDNEPITASGEGIAVEEPIEDESKLKSSASQGDLTETASLSNDESKGSDRAMVDSTHSKGSIEEQASVTVRESSRSPSLRLSNGSVTQDKRLSSPLSQSAKVEDGPVLLPPPSKVEKRSSVNQESEEVIKEESGDESVV